MAANNVAARTISHNANVVVVAVAADVTASIDASCAAPVGATCVADGFVAAVIKVVFFCIAFDAAALVPGVGVTLCVCVCVCVCVCARVFVCVREKER